MIDRTGQVWDLYDSLYVVVGSPLLGAKNVYRHPVLCLEPRDGRNGAWDLTHAHEAFDDEGPWEAYVDGRSRHA